MHATHAPLLHTLLVPHVVPLSVLVPVSSQVLVPVAHDVVPTWQAFVGAHARPAVHATHAPALQTSLVPHEVPSEALVPESEQTGWPVLHDVAPTWHALVGVQLPPALHATHAPE